MALGCALMIFGLCGGFILSGFALMAEGPHGPEGGITGDPSAGRTVAIVLTIGLSAFALGLFLLIRGWRR